MQPKFSAEGERLLISWQPVEHKVTEFTAPLRSRRLEFRVPWYIANEVRYVRFQIVYIQSGR